MSKNTTSKITPLTLQAGVWETELKQGPKIVLLALIDHLSFKRDDWRVWPSTETLAADCGMNRNAVAAHLKTLKSVNLIKTTTVSTPKGKRYDHEVAVETLMRYATNRCERKKRNATNRGIGTQRIVAHLCHESLHEVAERNSKVEVQTPAGKPQGGTESPEQVDRGKAHKVYLCWEEEIKKQLPTHSPLTKTEKRQLKDATAYFAESGSDPREVIRKTVRQWERFKVVAKTVRGWSKTFDGGGLSAVPTPKALLTFRSEAVHFYREDELQAAESAAFEKKQAARTAEAELEAARRVEASQQREAMREAFKRADPDYRNYTDELAAHRAKKSEPSFGMTEADCLVTHLGEPFTITPEKAWIQVEMNLKEALATIVRERDLEGDADRALFVEDARATNCQPHLQVVA